MMNGFDNKWYVVNVVWYDGSDAHVSKFIIQVDDFLEPTGESVRLVKHFIAEGNGDVLKFDACYPVDFENIMALKDAEDMQLRNAYTRFVEMYF